FWIGSLWTSLHVRAGNLTLHPQDEAKCIGGVTDGVNGVSEQGFRLGAYGQPCTQEQVEDMSDNEFEWLHKQQSRGEQQQEGNRHLAHQLCIMASAFKIEMILPLGGLTFPGLALNDEQECPVLEISATKLCAR
ncbi:hypothetical protein PoB_007647400, partial [Plakobranchus ocellatus]